MEGVHYDSFIFDKLKNIFSIRFGINLNDIATEMFDKHLLGNLFRLAPRDLVYIYLDIEENFEISLPDEDVANGALSTVNKIIQVIEKQLSNNKSIRI